MKIKTGVILVITVSLIFISANLIFSQEPTAQGTLTPETQNEPETQWVWGEVVTLDTQNKAVTLKYLDYETDQEKEINIATDDKTAYDNIKSIDEIKPKDTLSIDYIVSPTGKNIARNISMERPEGTQGMQEGNITEEKASAPTEEPKTAPAQGEQGY
jgi:hypothetical protein